MIYDPLVTEDYEWINLVDRDEYETFRNLDGTSVSKTWKPIIIKLVGGNNRFKPHHSDFPWLGGVLIIRQKVVDVMEEIFLKYGELLPVISEDGETLYAFNCHILDALDVEKSEIKLIPGTNRIMCVKKYVFKEDVIKGKHMFRITSLRSSSTFVNSDFVAEYKKHGLVGLDFRACYRESWDVD